jgi:hypothetical protein
LRNKAGSRALHFFCPDVEAAKELRDGLDDSSVSWQESS